MGMIYVTIGGKHKGLGSHEVHGGSPWGSGTVSGGDGSRQPSELELEIAQFQGYLFRIIIINETHILLIFLYSSKSSLIENF